MKKRFNENFNKLNRIRIALNRDLSNGLRLDRNEKVDDYSPEVIQGILDSFTAYDFSAYPEINSLYEKLAKWMEVNQECILLSSGSDAGIKQIIEMLSNENEKILVPSPTFAMYEVYCNMYNREFIEISYSPNDFLIDLESVYSQIDEKTALVFLPNPNQPIDTLNSIEIIEKLAQHCLKYNTFLVVDEAYYLFSDITAVGLTQRYDNVLVLRTFSKAFGLAGVRLGYIVGNKENIHYLEKTRHMIEANTLSIKSAEYLLDNMHFVHDYVSTIKLSQEYLKKELMDIGIKCTGANANFIFINLQTQDNRDDAIAYLKSKSIYVRGGFKEPWNSFIRVSIGTKEKMEIFIKEFKEWYKNYENFKYNLPIM
ncbi:MAG: histidinol-phosphate transaminase [Campylobacterales bacterium]|nr:histidinol-phosphate transaminase [Campylobacterales bacterium]